MTIRSRRHGHPAHWDLRTQIGHFCALIGPSSRLGSGLGLCGGLARGVPGGGRAGRVVHSGRGVGVLDAHLALEAVRVAEKDAEDGAEIGWMAPSNSSRCAPISASKTSR